jgi:hypothetical protein
VRRGAGDFLATFIALSYDGLEICASGLPPIER